MNALLNSTPVLTTQFPDIQKDSKSLDFTSKTNSSLLSLDSKTLQPLVETTTLNKDTFTVNSLDTFVITKEALLANDIFPSNTVLGKVNIFIQEFNEDAINGLFSGRSSQDSLLVTPSNKETFGSYSIFDVNNKFLGSSTFVVNADLTNPANSAPVAKDDLFNITGVQSIDGKYNSFRERSYTGRDTIPYVKLDVFANDSDAENNPLKIVSVDFKNQVQSAFSPINIKVDDGNIFIAPKAGFKGEVKFDYTISDGLGGFSTAFVTLNIDPNFVVTPPITPLVKDDVFAGRQNAFTRFTVADLLSNDTGVIFDSISDPEDGFLLRSADNQSFFYTPNPGFVGSDTFEYTTKSSTGEILKGKITIEIPFPTLNTQVINSMFEIM